MDWNTIQQLVRIIMQVISGMLVTRGIMTEEIAVTLTGAVLSISQVAWWFIWNKNVVKPAVAPSQQ